MFFGIHSCFSANWSNSYLACNKQKQKIKCRTPEVVGTLENFGNKNYRIGILVYLLTMKENNAEPLSFIEQMRQELLDYQVQKAIKMDFQAKTRSCPREKAAMETLIEVDDEMDVTHNSEEDVCVGRWSNYKVPQKIEDRLNLSKKTRRHAINSVPSYRYLQSNDRALLPNIYRSQKTIPKLKVMLHQLDCPLNIETDRQSERSRVSSCTKLKSYVGSQALVISNKQQIKSSIKSERKTISTVPNNIASDLLSNIENRRPPTGNSVFRGQTGASSYHKIKRTFGNQDHAMLQEKQLLSQLIKNNINKAQTMETTAPLSNMLNYFTMSGSETKRKVSSKLGLDKLLS